MQIRAWEVAFALVCLAAAITSLVLLATRPANMSDETALWMFVLLVGSLVLLPTIVLGWRLGALVGRIAGQIVGSRRR
jgi:O-antigen/teichoic acid export membrane protein